MRWRELQGRIRRAFWLMPAGCVAAAVAVALVLVQLDEGLERRGGGVAFTGGPDSARSLLSAIASSMLTFTALVFSITVVVLQLTSSQFSPRVLRTFLHDRQTQVTLGVFVATFVYALIALREVRGEDGVVDRFVPGITISVAFALVLLCVGLFVAYIHHIANSIRVITIVTRIREETEAAVDECVPRDAVPLPVPPPAGHGARVVCSTRSGVIVSVDVGRLVREAGGAAGALRLVPRIGDFVPRGAPLLVVPPGMGVDDHRLEAAVALDVERDTHQDVAFGIRQLVDIAERALSPGINDPTTAVQCLDQVHVILRRLADRPLPSGAHADERGVVRLVVPTTTWADYVALACDEIRHWGAQSLQVHRRLRALLADLLEAAPPERHPPLHRQLALLDARAAELPEAEQASAMAPTGPGAADARQP